LAGGLTVISAGFYALDFYLAGNHQLSQVGLALVGASLGFLMFNFGKAKIFMGDNGSTFIGIILSVLFITHLQENSFSNSTSPTSSLYAFAIILTPVADMIKVVFGRLIRGNSPFHGDRTHIHHLLHKHGLGPTSSCILLYSWQVAIVLFAQYCLPQNFWLAALTLGMSAGFPYFALTVWSKFRPSVIQAEEKKPHPLNAPSAGELL
jgi:UDP-N-acetylmuramyl pentapeptide phosphotransferase/UDP-N-acetylglucosamine-1-phosphate transferase